MIPERFAVASRTQAGGISKFSLGTSGVTGSQYVDVFLCLLLHFTTLCFLHRLGWAWMDGINIILSGISPVHKSIHNVDRIFHSQMLAT